ncbi:MAG: hypothetical protein FJZ00_11730 [Candidatus Sericytochromatia bacterium]|uniref:Uncharacterized protein n=1 Tax=Candidatus Tanganyikabacteria bacterium TaxID=2961651 RepID=A0A937X4B8_9BACT|nr:hypothetical protein [Candidatus Tanganyikabacteria bacterium]
MNDPTVKVGDKVSAGHVFGKVGNFITGSQSNPLKNSEYGNFEVGVMKYQSINCNDPNVKGTQCPLNLLEEATSPSYSWCRLIQAG